MNRNMGMGLGLAIALVAGAVSLVANSGHFLTGGANAPTCSDVGTQVECSGKVAGLGGTTFEITIEAPGIATVSCENPGGNVAPGQDTAVTVAGTTSPLPTPTNGQYIFSVTSDDPAPLPPTPTCPNDQWTPHITDVRFSTCTLSLYEDGILVNRVTVSVN